MKAFHESLHGITDYKIAKARKRKQMQEVLEGKYPKEELEFIDLKQIANERRKKKDHQNDS